MGDGREQLVQRKRKGKRKTEPQTLAIWLSLAVSLVASFPLAKGKKGRPVEERLAARKKEKRSSRLAPAFYLVGSGNCARERAAEKTEEKRVRARDKRERL